MDREVWRVRNNACRNIYFAHDAQISYMNLILSTFPYFRKCNLLLTTPAKSLHFEFSMSRIRHLCRGTAGDTQSLAVDPVRVVAGQEAHDSGDVDGLSDTAEGGDCGKSSLHLVDTCDYIS